MATQFLPEQMVSPRGRYPLAHLLGAAYADRLVKLLALQSVIREDAPTVLAASFDSTFKTISELGAPAQRAVLEHPSFGFWEDVAVGLIRRRTHQIHPGGQPSAHVREFGKFTLAAAMLEGKAFATELRLDDRGRLHLPGLDCYIAFPAELAYHLVECEFTGNVLFLRTGSSASRTRIDRPLVDRLHMRGEPYAARLGGCELRAVRRAWDSLAIDNTDRNLRLPGRVNYEYEDLDSGDRCRRWVESIKSCRELVRIADPLLEEELFAALRVIVPVQSRAKTTHLSATFCELPGAVYCSWTPNTIALALALVHEFHHYKLSLFIGVSPLLDGANEEKLLYSPLRRDPRPMIGLLHAAYVLLGMARFLSQVLKTAPASVDRDAVAQELTSTVSQTEGALASLRRHGSLTASGERFLEAMRNEVDLLQNEVLWGRCSGVGAAVIATHRDEWKTSYKPWLCDVRGTSAADIAETEADLRLAERLRQLLGHRIAGSSVDNAPDAIETDWSLEGLAGIRDSAPEEFQALRQLVGSGPLGSFVAGDIAFLEGRYSDAATLYLDSLKVRRTWLNCWTHFGLVLRHLGHKRVAERVLLEPSACMKILQRESGWRLDDLVAELEKAKA